MNVLSMGKVKENAREENAQFPVLAYLQCTQGPGLGTREH